VSSLNHVNKHNLYSLMLLFVFYVVSIDVVMASDIRL